MVKNDIHFFGEGRLLFPENKVGPTGWVGSRRFPPQQSIMRRKYHVNIRRLGRRKRWEETYKDANERSMDIFAHVILCIGAFIMFFPFFWMVSTSLKTYAETIIFPPALWPAEPQWSNYQYVLDTCPFFLFYWNSIVVTVCTVAGQLVTCSMGAYAFSRLRFKGRDKMFVLYLATLMIPSQVTMIPTYIMMSKIGWIDSFKAIIIPNIFSAYGTFLLRQFFMGIPTELEESIRIDGGGAYRCFWHIVLPLSKTALITFGTFVFQFAWNNYLWPLLVTNSLEKYVLPMGINFFTGQFTTYYQYMMAAATMAMLPMIVVYLFAQRYFVAGISLSGIKA